MIRFKLIPLCLFCLLTIQGCESRAEYDAEGLFKQVSPSIVTVQTFDEKGRQQGQGSGVVVDKGRIVTNCHVVREADSLKIASGSEEYAASWTLTDPSRDICILSVDGMVAPAVDIRKMGDVKIGEPVFAVGNPLGFTLSVSSGLVSSISPYRDEPVIVASVPLSPGSSGGGLFDTRGRLLGITTAILTAGQSLNIVLPADWIAELSKRGVAPPPSSVIPGPEPRWMEEAQALQGAGNFPEFERHVRKWREAQPKSALAAAYLGVALFEKNPTEAEMALREAVRLDDRNEFAWFVLAKVLYRLDRRDEAKQLLQKAELINPNHGSVYATKAEWLLTDGKPKEAYATVRDAIRVEPGVGDHWRLLGIIADRLNRADESAKAYKAALRLNPMDASAKQALSNVLARNGKADAARLTLGNEIDNNPSSAGTWISIGFTESGRKHYADAEKAFRKAIEIAPETSNAWIGLGAVLTETNRLKEAEQAYDKAYDSKPNNPGVIAEILTNRGNVKSKLGDKRAALADIEAAVKIDPTYINAYRSLGILKVEVRDHRAVVDAFGKVITSDLAGPDDWATLAESLEAIGDNKAALEALEKSEKLDPNNPKTLQALTGYYGRNGDLQKALVYIERALKIDSSSAVNWSSKGYALLKLGRLPEAISTLETATNLDPQFANAWINLGEAQMRSNNLGKAITSLERAVSLAPTAPDARLYLAQSYLNSRQAEKARTHANALLKAQPELPQALAIVTLADLMDNNSAAALTNYRKIQARSPQIARSVKAMAISQGLSGAQTLPD
ncbi:serine protease [Methylomonas methanica]|uniref:Tetratricopeptide TPR_2 repeat-containing protein n=1 Tax=Methylomonas methanica (strain DSM 25384 / MC09) TaxID=857087 RepID=G0A4W2_METMM|nr:serine protease [Methylomonas methanica]AEF99125.1 Tetratricopeptide TPR_2 repeat-containing protein [Methylomonas methanica MC09]